MCHTLEAANAVAQVGPNLDTLRPTKALVLDAIENGRARGNGAMARNLVIGEDAEDVAEFVAAGRRSDETASSAKPRRGSAVLRLARAFPGRCPGYAGGRGPDQTQGSCPTHESS